MSDERTISIVTLPDKPTEENKIDSSETFLQKKLNILIITHEKIFRKEILFVKQQI